MTNISEKVKTVVDDFGRLSFMLETYVKLAQTSDHAQIADSIVRACLKDADKLCQSLSELVETLNPVESE